MASLALALNAGAYTVVVSTTDGDTSYAPASITSIVPSPAGGMTVNLASGGSSLFASDKFLTITFDTTSGVNAVAAEKATAMRYDGTTVSAQGAIQLFSTTGQLMATGRDAISTSSLSKGVYIARAGEQTIKICVR
ncbi:MAG: T9SS type A sorting domain-containing protein [Bacteroidales bacterium]|nr:T9SS type A sorting domain-containing protein [Bacteroidales bacterium]